MDAVTRVQNLEEAVCVSYKSNTLEKRMNLIILPLAVGK